MGLRVFENIVRNDSVRTVVSPHDDAIDKDASGGEEGIKRYRETCDMALLTMKPRSRPTLFDISPLTADQLEQLELEATARLPHRDADGNTTAAAAVLKLLLVFERGCRRVYDVELVDDEGLAKHGDLPRDRWTASIPAHWRVAIGSMIAGLSSLPSPEERADDVGKS